MTCREFVEFLMSYLDGELAAEARDVFEDHTRLCPPCLVYLDTYRETVHLGRGACCDDDDALPDDVPEELIQAILAARVQQRGNNRGR